MIHKIKALHDEGRGMSCREIARTLGISRNTVRKYLLLDADSISESRKNTSRSKKLDAWRDNIIHLLQKYPKLSAVKVLRKLTDMHGDIGASSRTVRRYIESLRETVTTRQQRYYEPVIDNVPGLQCQVDGGELRGVMVGGEERTVYFVVFVLSYSRLMHVSLSPVPVDTERFIRMHDAAFRYFGGMPAECVYDQTKLVVLHEQYRELTLNNRFHAYATHAGFTIRACEGYDPESKGKVEAGVKYVKGNALYGEAFRDWDELESYMAGWLDNIANNRIHGTTQEVPRQRYEDVERGKMRICQAPFSVHPHGQGLVTRKVDKTGLISWQSNKYSVPMVYQGSVVGAVAEEGFLRLFDRETGEVVASHRLCPDKGQVIRNRHHYRDLNAITRELEEPVLVALGSEYGQTICNLLKTTSPKIYRDQLRGLRLVLSRYPELQDPLLLEKLCQQSRLTVTGIESWVEAWKHQKGRNDSAPDTTGTKGTDALAGYGVLTSTGGRHAVMH